MNRRLVIAAMVTGLGASAGQTLAAGKTVVTVNQGRVRVETAAGNSTVEAGQRAVMAPGIKPLPGVNEELVEDMLRIDRLAQAEVQEAKARFDGVLITVCSIESEKLWKLATLMEMVNSTDQPGQVCRIGNMASLIEPKFYDLEGRLLHHEWKRNAKGQGPCSVHVLEPVAPRSKYRFVCVATAAPPPICMYQDGKLWHAWQANDSPFFLNYFRFVLPPTALLVETSRPALVTDVRGGRLAVTVRNYTGADADGELDLSFVWPERDGTGLDDLPSRLRQNDSWTASIQGEYERRMAGIIAGQRFSDQRTPLDTLLTRNAAILRGDRQLLDGTLYAPDAEQRNAARGELDKLEKEFGGLTGLRELLIDPVKAIATPRWPEQPPEGAVHTITMCAAPGQTTPVFTMGLVFSNGKWLIEYNRPGPALAVKERVRATTSAPAH